MIWIDITDPKYVLFFRSLIPLLKSLDSVVVTTRKSKDYEECYALLELFQIPSICIGSYGGNEIFDKLEARLKRQEGFLELFKRIGKPNLFITGVSVEGTQTAFGLGIPIIQFSDTPLASHRFELSKITVVAKLTLPLSSLIFRPFVVPEICYSALGVEPKNIIAYPFIDVALWLKDLPQGEDFRKRYHLPTTRPTILLREEEYKAHYVRTKLPIIYESIPLLNELDANLVIMPRYGSAELHRQFSSLKNLTILEEKLPPQDFYPFIDILIGGGGTMNLESCYLGIPTISTRSLFLFHDKYLLDHHLMQHHTDSQALYHQVKAWIAQETKRKNQREFFESSPANFQEIFAIIQERYYKHQK
ncbi:Uncharacterized protein conserved in archaea [Helicobacter mustelae]|uniref:DUF354 domain-containing protein n=1 Tax=Helicobacter mustelae TaxID=217 RepID=UPI000E039971|nr:DUF354 domain-containing protein [Helicobacter mustelae]STP14166.1 Uncharacterized protein conserved in archaea [Helicobacter mustelae]